MTKIDLSKIQYSADKNKNVLAQTEKFKIRNIELEAGQQIPECNMENWVLFYVRKGKGKIFINKKETIMAKESLVFTEPAMVSIKAKEAMKILGIIVK
jgi:quercetin dioxygenase-like cupin family protein